MSAALEVLIVALGVVLLRRAPAWADRPRERSVRLQSLALGPAIALIAVATSFALLSPDGVAGHGADDHAHNPADAHGPAEAQPVEAQPAAPEEPTVPDRTTPDADPSAEIEQFATAAPDVHSDPTPGHDHADGEEPEPHAH